MKRDKITQEMVKEFFTYRNGKLFWKIKPKNQIQIGDRVGNKLSRSSPYRELKVRGLKFLEHKIIFLYHKGYMPKCVDHIKDTLNSESVKSNKIENLREATMGQNSQRRRSTNPSTRKYRGVCKRGRGFQVELAHKKLGVYPSELDACIVYDKKCLELYGELCFTNLPRKNYLKGGKHFEYLPEKCTRDKI